MNKLKEVTDYIENKQKGSLLGVLEESIDGLDNLRQDIGLEKISTGEKLNNWLGNDKNLLDYAKNYLELEKTKSDFGMQILELKLSITCSFFADFKQFLSDLKEAESNEEYTESEASIDSSESAESLNSGFIGTPLSQIKSNPFHKNSKTGVTRCSTTARYNGASFGLELPSGDAYKAGTKAGNGVLDTIPSSKKNNKPSNKWSNISFDEFTSINSNDKANFADIYTDSKSTYGHRVVGFKASDGQWYVLDPYNNVNGMNNKPKKLQDYMAKKGIKKVHFYQSKGYEYKDYKAGVD